jgi:magnesium transporter
MPNFSNIVYFCPALFSTLTPAFVPMAFEITKEYFEQIEAAIDNKDEAFLKEAMDELYPADIAALIYELPSETEMKYLLNLLEREVSAEVITNLDSYARASLLELFSSEELALYVNNMDSDDGADVLNEQDIQTREEVIALLEDREKARHIIDLLHFEEDSAGGLMQKELVKANINWNIQQCIREIRRQAARVEMIHSIYVVDDKGILKGRVSLKKIILSRGDTRVADIFEPDIVAVETYRSQREVAEIMRHYDLEAIPVVNVNGKLLGRITIDDIVDVMEELATAERQAMSGLSGDAEEEDTVLTSVRTRLPWLLIGMTGGLMVSRVIGLFGGEIAQEPAIAFFTPLIAGTAGNVAIQSSSVILQTLANKSGLITTGWERSVKVFLIALLNGAILGACVLLFNYLVGINLALALVVSIALLSVVLLASFTGTITPLILNRLGINPAVASGPFITTANDLLGTVVYFSTANLLL